MATGINGTDGDMKAFCTTAGARLATIDPSIHDDDDDDDADGDDDHDDHDHISFQN